jgi:cytoskeletal protein CcmA (bactofilin family)
MTQHDTDHLQEHTEAPHFDEMTALLYLEQQLDDPRSRSLVAHTNSCASCRELLRVLKNESVWLQDALSVDEEPIPARFILTPERTRASWGWVIALGFGWAGIYTLWTGLIQPWTAQASDIGFNQLNVMTLLLFSGAFWSGWSDVRNILEFLAVTTLCGLGAWLLRRFFRRGAPVAAVMGAFLLLLFLPLGARAGESVHGNPSYTLPAGQEIKTDLFVSADRAQMDGNIDGDLVVWAHEVEVNGHVKGDIIAFTQELRVNGNVDGNVRVFAAESNINGSVGRNLMAFVQRLDVGERASVGGSATVFAGDVQLTGPIKGDLLATANSIEIDNLIGGNARIRGNTLNIGSSAQIAGTASFEGPNQPSIAPGAKLASTLEVTMQRNRTDYGSWPFYWHEILRWGAAFLLGLVFLLVAPGVFFDVTAATKRAGLAMGIGLLFLVGVPVAVIIACATIIGLGVGIATFLIYVVAIYMSQVFVGAWLGEKLLGVGIGVGPMLARLALGLAILRVVRMIPFAGWLSVWVVIVWGLGAYILSVHKRLRQQAVLA